jgi:hypothetical protein
MGAEVTMKRQRDKKAEVEEAQQEITEAASKNAKQIAERKLSSAKDALATEEGRIASVTASVERTKIAETKALAEFNRATEMAKSIDQELAKRGENVAKNVAEGKRALKNAIINTKGPKPPKPLPPPGPPRAPPNKPPGVGSRARSQVAAQTKPAATTPPVAAATGTATTTPPVEPVAPATPSVTPPPVTPPPVTPPPVKKSIFSMFLGKSAAEKQANAANTVTAITTIANTKKKSTVKDLLKPTKGGKRKTKRRTPRKRSDTKSR